MLLSLKNELFPEETACPLGAPKSTAAGAAGSCGQRWPAHLRPLPRGRVTAPPRANTFMSEAALRPGVH